MKARWPIVALLAAAAGLAVAVTAAADATRAPRDERTHPHVRPESGTTQTTFRLSFTLRETPGHQGVMATDYRVQVAPHQGAASSCWPMQPPVVRSGRKGQAVRLTLDPPPSGWCPGAYHVTVYLERGPYCPPPTNGRPEPCPEFATQEMNTGRARFTAQR